MKPSATVFRDFLIKCEAKPRARYLTPINVSEIKLTPDDPDTEYVPVGKSSPYFGEIREPLEKRGDLVTLKNGDYRITRRSRIGKSIREGRNGIWFVQVRVKVSEWKQFTKRTNEPKLGWLERQCGIKGIRIVREGESAHAPITYVHRDDETRAWDILNPVDNVRDDHPRFNL